MNAALRKPREAPRSRKQSTLVVGPRKLSVQCSSNSGRWRAICQAKVTKRVVEILTEAEIRQVLATLSTPTASNVRNRAIFLTLLDTEIRASELLTPMLQRARLDEGCLLVLGKGKKERPVKIGTAAAAAMRTCSS